MRRTLLRETALFRKYSLASSHEILSLGASFTQLRGQGMLKVEGPDTAAFLQGLITQDIKLLNSFETVYTGWLSNKGRMLYGSILSRPASGEIYIHLPREQVSELQRYVRMVMHLFDSSLYYVLVAQFLVLSFVTKLL
jgi:folate-binding Fe-S cluster repair protein YgfZ